MLNFCELNCQYNYVKCSLIGRISNIFAVLLLLCKYYLVFSNHNLNTFVRGIMRPINWFKENTLIKNKILC